MTNSPKKNTKNPPSVVDIILNYFDLSRGYVIHNYILNVNNGEAYYKVGFESGSYEFYYDCLYHTVTKVTKKEVTTFIWE